MGRSPGLTPLAFATDPDGVVSLVYSHGQMRNLMISRISDVPMLETKDPKDIWWINEGQDYPRLWWEADNN
jgi:hypothetical protein